MNHNPYILFNKTFQQARRIGARGGRATARNRRAGLLALASLPPERIAQADPDLETAAEASAALDAQFPWLRGAERRLARSSG
jgi:hypothetical protein